MNVLLSAEYRIYYFKWLNLVSRPLQYNTFFFKKYTDGLITE
jgi:hypothetical protein